MATGIGRTGVMVLCMSLVACGSDPGGDATLPGEVEEPAIGEKVAAPVDGATAQAAGEPVAGDIEEEAAAILKRMTSAVASLEGFSVTLETGFDVTQPNGEKLEFGSRRSASISRPDKAHFRFQKRSGEAGELVFDGSDIWAFDREANAYASIPQPGDIDASIDFATTELGMPVPASDFFAADPSISLAEGVLAARDLGPSTIAGRPGRQVAMRKAGVDYQIWVADEGSLPIRIVITYIEEPGQPQFWAQFIEWDPQPVSQAGEFRFVPPEGSERIRFATYDSSAQMEEGVAQ